MREINTLPNDVLERLSQFITKVPKLNFNLSVITDMHYDKNPNFDEWGVYKNSDLALKHLDYFLTLGKIADVLILNGDQTNGFERDTLTTSAVYKGVVDKLFNTEMQADKFAVIGNHDDGSPMTYQRGYVTPNDVLNISDIKKIHRTSEQLNRENRDDGSLYWMKDYPEKKIRLIGLDTEDVDYSITGKDGYCRYNRWLWHAYRQQQMNWLANIALKNVPSNYHTMIVGHCPLYYQWEDLGAHHVNHDIVRGIITAFITGSKYIGQADEKVVGEGFGINIKVDYSAQGPHQFIGFFAGHTHEEKIVDLNSFKVIHLKNDICTDDNLLGTAKEMAFTTISVNPHYGHVDLLGFGNATIRSYDYL